VAPPPPAPDMGMAPSGGNFTIKRKIQTKHKLPTLNWIVLKPNQVHYNDDINQYEKNNKNNYHYFINV
jgi:hypothetical protein